MAAEIKVKAGLDRSAYDKGLDAMKDGAKQLNSSMQNLGSIGGIMAGVFGGNMISGMVSGVFGKLSSAIAESREQMIQLSHDSENIGIDPQALNGIQETFDHFGQSGDKVAAMFGRMAQARDKALGGNEKMVASFRDLGISIADLTSMDTEELFNKIARAYAGSTGGVRSAAGDVMGKGLRGAGASRALSDYGEGKRYGAAYDLQSTTVIQSGMVDQKNKEAWHTIGNIAQEFWTRFTSPIGSHGDAEQEGIDRQFAQMKTNRHNREALAHTQETDAMKKAAGTAEDERYAKDVEAERKREIEEGLSVHVAQGDSYARKGMMAGGGAVNTMAYQQGRRQVQLAEQLLESSRKIEAQLGIKKRHDEALKNISGMVGGASDQVQEVE